MCTYTYACVFVYIYIYMYISLSLSISIYIYIYIYTCIERYYNYSYIDYGILWYIIMLIRSAPED